MESIFLLTLGGFIFLSIYLTSSCEYDEGCALGSRCCKQTGAGRVLEKGECVLRETCRGFCLMKADCLPPERCNTSQNICTAKCFHDADCHQGYICKNDRCVEVIMYEPDGDDPFQPVELKILAIMLYSVPVIIALSIFGCCLFYVVVKPCNNVLNHRGRNCTVDSLNGNPPTSANAQQQNNELLEITLVRLPVDTSVLSPRHEQDNAELERLEIGSNSLPVNEANRQSVDAIASIRPPSGTEICVACEVHPPTYEEAVRDSTVILNMYRTTEFV